MALLVENIDWVAVGLSTLLCYFLGALWYSPALFGARWARELGSDAIGPGKPQPILALSLQLFGTLMLAWVIAVAAATGSWAALLPIAGALLALHIASGQFAGHSPYVLAVDGGYYAVMLLIMIGITALLA